MDERERLQRALELAGATSPEAFARGLIGPALETLGASRGYVAILSPEEVRPVAWAAHGLDDVALERIRGALSSGIMARAIATGETIVTASARSDPRFSGRDSVRRGAVDAVVCIPVGAPPTGVLYVEGKVGGGPFSSADVAWAERLAALLARPLARIAAEPRNAPDPTAAWRARFPMLAPVVGRSEALARLFGAFAAVAPAPVDVLILGPSGTGKNLLAKALHEASGRRGRLVEVGCASIASELAEAELFGAVKGAYTGATGARDGAVAMAEGGTLFLDEIGDMPLQQQAKLLRLVQSREYDPVGSTGNPRRADVRVVAATNVDLARAVREGRFRADLLYRLDVFPLRVPALAERREDLALLAEHLRLGQVRRGLPDLPLTRGAVVAIEAADWPGNVRSLGQVVTRGLLSAQARGADAVEPVDLFPDTAPPQDPTWQEATRRFQRSLLARTLEDHAWDVQRVSRVLDLSRSQIYSLILAFGLRGPPSGPPDTPGAAAPADRTAREGGAGKS